MKNSRQDPPGSQEEIKRDACERVYPASRDKVFAQRLCRRVDVYMCVCVCERGCLPACLDICNLKKYPGSVMHAIRFQLS